MGNLMKPLEPPDSLHPEAAAGWISLGDYAAANEELEQLAPASRAHTLDKLGRTQEAKDPLLSAVNGFESNSTIPYHLARYCARPGQTDQADRFSRACRPGTIAASSRNQTVEPMAKWLEYNRALKAQPVAQDRHYL